jgi:predicted peptidase
MDRRKKLLAFVYLAASAAAVMGCSALQTDALPAPSDPAVEIRTAQRAHVMETILTRRAVIPYLLHLPERHGLEPDERWPLIMYLHGGSLRGSDPQQLRVWGVPKVADEDPSFSFVVVAPQAPKGALWTDTDGLIALLDHITARYAIDPGRVYLTGHSMGGNGTWFLAYTAPERFAAIAPLSGPANTWWWTRLVDMPVWVFHGEHDEIVPIRESEEMVRALRDGGNERVRFTALPDRGHGIVPLYEDPELYDWFLEHRRP